ncbi:MAG: hypothetical protein ACE367_04965 [Acidimicrobiales bacterium]
MALGLAANSLLGPLAANVIDYRYSDSMIYQAIGLDAVALGVAVPLASASAWLVHRGHQAGPVLAMSPALFAAYMMPQYVVGPDYLGLDGNNENFALGHIVLFVLAVAVAAGAWRSVDRDRLRPDSRRSDRRRTWLLAGVAAFIALGRQIPIIAGVIDDPTSSDAYLDNPTAFWLVAFLDLGVVTPAALAAAGGLWVGTQWARTAAYAVIGWFALVPVSVAAMNVSMRVHDDPLVTTADTVLFGVAAVVFSAAAVWLYRPLFEPQSSVSAGASTPEPAAPDQSDPRGVSWASRG